MKRGDSVRRVRDIILALLCTGLVVVSMFYNGPVSIENPDLIMAQEQRESEGIPQEIQGVWEYAGDGEMVSQSVILRGNQMIITDEYNGTIYYTVPSTIVAPRFEMEGVEDTPATGFYTLQTDINDYLFRYGDDLAAMAAETFYFVYDSEQDVLIPQADIHFVRNIDRERVQIIKDNLVTSQPINYEDLNDVSDELLLSLYNENQDLSEEERLLNIYRGVAEVHPNLNLLRNEAYEMYKEISQKIIDQAEIPYRRLNQAGPFYILELYQEAQEDNQTEAEIIAAIKPEIETAIQGYHDRKLKHENSLRTSPSDFE